MTKDNQDESHRRSATRAPIGRPIRLQFDDSMDVIVGECRNISIGGMFIDYASSRPPGSLVRFELALEDDSAVRGLGEVVWMRAKNDFGGPDAGFGLKFRFLEQQDRQLIFKLVSEHIKQRLSRREGEPGIGDAGATETFESTVPLSTPPLSSEAPLVPPAPKQEAELELHLPPPSDSTPEPLAPPRPAAEIGAPDQPSEVLPSIGQEIEAENLPPRISPAAMAQRDITPTDAGAADNSDSPPGVDLQLSSMDLDPSVGDTPLFEMGLDPEPQRPSLFQQPPAASDDPADPIAPEPSAWGATASAERDRNTSFETAARPEVPGLGEPAKRSFGLLSVLPALLVLLLAVGAVYYFFGGDRDQDVAVVSTGVAAVETTPETAAAADLPAVSESDTDALEGAASQGSESGIPEPTLSETAANETVSTPLEVTADPIRAAPPIREPTPSPPVVAAPAPAPQEPDSTGEPAKQPQAAMGTFSRLLDISWDDISTGSKVILTADGPIATGRYKYLRLGGDSPREVVKLLGVTRPFDKTLLPVVAPGIRQIRTGYHRTSNGSEIHIVIDLVGPKWKITEVRNLDDRLEIMIGQ